jgi:hypothetical protein
MAYQSQIAKQVRALALKYNVGGGTAANPRQWRRAEEQSSPEPGTSGEQLTIC